jgi:hypothetical protein
VLEPTQLLCFAFFVLLFSFWLEIRALVPINYPIFHFPSLVLQGLRCLVTAKSSSSSSSSNDRKESVAALTFGLLVASERVKERERGAQRSNAEKRKKKRRKRKKKKTLCRIYSKKMR